MVIYSKPRSNQKKELEFRENLLKLFPECIHKEEKCVLNEDLVYCEVNIPYLIKNIESNQYITNYKRKKCIPWLNSLPDEIYVVNNINNISVDVTLTDEHKTYLIEFHEVQHRIDGNCTRSAVYNANEDAIYVPRFIQRLIRDVWRWENLDNYSIVWYDWFKKNKDFKNYLRPGKYEYALNNKFMISDLS